jgi:hypothetical protein
MSILYSPEQSASPSERVYELEDTYFTKAEFLAAVQAQNRQHQGQCGLDRKRSAPAGFVNRETAVALFCPNPDCTMRILAKTPKSGPGKPRHAVLKREVSVLQHIALCTSVPKGVTCKELLANDEFVVRAAGMKGHKEILKLVHSIFKVKITTTMSSKVRSELLGMKAFDGYHDGFTKVRDVLDAIVAAHIGTVYKLTRDDNKVFQSLVVVPAQSRKIVLYSAQDCYGVDGGHSDTKQGYKAHILILEATDSNNISVPVAFGIYHSESGDNFSDFLSVCISTFAATVDGVEGKQLNRRDVVIVSYRGTAIPPALRACLPLAYHRYDQWHIMKNVHDRGWNSESK